MRFEPFQNIEEVVAAIEEMSGDDDDPVDMIIIHSDIAGVSDKGEGNDEPAEADVSQSFPRDVAGSIKIHTVFAIPEPDSDDLPIISPTLKRKDWTTPKAQANQAPQWKKQKVYHSVSALCE